MESERTVCSLYWVPAKLLNREEGRLRKSCTNIRDGLGSGVKKFSREVMQSDREVYSLDSEQRCAGAGPGSEFLIGTGFGAGVIFYDSVFEISMSMCTLSDFWQESINFV